MKNVGRYNQESDNAQSVWTVLYHSIASVPFDLLVADGPSGNRGMGISSRLLFSVWEDPLQ